MSGGNDVKWYAMNAFRGGALSVQNMLTKLEIENFVPKHHGTVIVKGNKIKHLLKPIIPSLIFIKSTFSELDEICHTTQNLHFRYTKIHGGNRNVPISIPNEDMERFIEFIDGNEEHINYITDPDVLNIEVGERVRITEGPFVGKEAIFMKLANVTKRQIVVKIEGVLGASVICKFPSRIVEKI